MTSLLRISCLIALLAALPLCGCGGGGGSATTPLPGGSGGSGGGGGGGGSSGVTGRDASGGGTAGGPTGGSSTWFERINQFRSWGGLAPVSADATLAAACVSHSRYMVKEDSLTHAENMASSWYTAAGDAAGQSSNVVLATSEQSPRATQSIEGQIKTRTPRA